jgi:hypothetical protein
VRIVLGKGVVGANLTEPQPGKTLMDALHPQAVEQPPVAPVKKIPRKKKAI